MARGPNQKAVAAAEKKAANQAAKDAEKARQNAAKEAEEWKKGSNTRAASKAEEAAAKADEKARQKRERAELLAAEEAAMGSGKAVKSKGGAASKKAGGKKKNDLALLEDALIGDAEKQNKEKKRLERIKKEREAQQSAEREKKQKEEQAMKDPLLANTDAMIGMDGPDDDGGNTMAVGRKANVSSMDDIQASGLDSALSKLSMGAGGDDRHPEKRIKAAYKAYEEKMMPEVKQQYPGLKRQQYLDKIFALWKKSPENPMNQV
eukprot:scaffold145251_cov73-Cyclotella_meneghiniana.AAC.3